MNAEQLNILAIEDDAEDVLLLRRVLDEITAWEVHLTVCKDSASALGELAEKHIDLILMDYHLGSETGLTALATIQQTGYSCPVVFLTGRGDEQVAVKTMKAGAADYLPKYTLSAQTLRQAMFFALEKEWIETRIERRRDELENTNFHLRIRNEEMQSFYHTIAQELSTPLKSIREFLGLLGDRMPGPLNEMQGEYVELAGAASEQMAKCIDDLLDVGRIETGTLKIDPQPGSIGDVVREVVRMMEPVACEKSVWLREDVNEPLPEVTMDRVRVVQIIRNLIVNALESTPANGEIEVRAETVESDPSVVRITVKDCGRGIPVEELDRIFERFHKVPSGPSESGHAGLGLTICKALIEMHGGRISAESVQGKGSTFAFTLPVAVLAFVQNG